MQYCTPPMNEKLYGYSRNYLPVGFYAGVLYSAVHF